MKHIKKYIIITFLLLSIYVSKNYLINFLNNTNMHYTKYVYLGGENIVIYIKNDMTNNENTVANTNETTASGILTYIDYETNIFGAIAHNITDSNKKVKGKIYASSELSINKSGKEIGNKIMATEVNKEYGTVYKTSDTGVYGLYENTMQEKVPIQIAMPSEIHLGKAYIVTSINNEIKQYEITITNINMFTNTQNISLKITDKELISKTNGIIKGMSGSPIIQDNKLIGALSHSDNKNYLNGNAIFITNMLN